MTATTTAPGHPAITLISRLLLAWLFIPAGIGKLTGFAGTVGYIASKGLPVPEVMAVLAIGAELGLGIAILLGFQTRLAALGLALFTLAAAFLFHNYWGVPAAEVMGQQINFNKNIAITGGLLALVAWGAGAWSLDGRRSR